MMRNVALVLALSAVATGGALAVNPTVSGGGGGGTNVLNSDRDLIWSEPPDLEGLIASSEVIGQFGLETEIANDFYLTQDNTIGYARWWGGYYNNNGCGDIGAATHWNLRFYNDGGCMPLNVLSEMVNAPAHEVFIYCQGGFYPIFEYESWVYTLEVSANTLYWFGAQAADHAFPPQCGRVASGGVVGCDSVFKSSYFSHPDWTPGIDVFGVAFDASQEFEPAIGGREGACCIGDQGECEMVEWLAECEYLGGQWQGYDVDCDPNPCDVTPVKDASWGQIKSLYR